MPRILVTQFRLGLAVLAVAIILASCGGSTTPAAGGSTTTPTVEASTMNTTPTTAPMSGAVVVKTATVKLNGQSTTILTDTRGRTLYYFTSDTPTQSACTGGCA